MCPVCGYPQDPEHPLFDENGWPTYFICPCCAFESGFDGTEEVHFRQYRRRWIRKGMPWFARDRKPPEGWDPIKQMRDAGIRLDEGEDGS